MRSKQALIFIFAMKIADLIHNNVKLCFNSLHSLTSSSPALNFNINLHLNIKNYLKKLFCYNTQLPATLFHLPFTTI